MKIYSRYNSEKVIYESEKETIEETVVEAVNNKANPSGADLSRANLSGADLSGADLSRANLRETDLSRANLREADLSRADLSGADLSGADLSRANLRGIKNYLSSHYIGIELSKREYKKFTQKEKAFIFEFIATIPCWDNIKERFGKTALSVFKKLKKAGWAEYYDHYVKFLKESE